MNHQCFILLKPYTNFAFLLNEEVLLEDHISTDCGVKPVNWYCTLSKQKTSQSHFVSPSRESLPLMWEPIFVLLGEHKAWEELIWLVSVERLCYFLANFQSTIWFLGRTSNILQNASKSGLAFCGFMVLSPALMGTTSFSGNSSYCSDLKEFPRHRILSSYQTWLVLELSYCIFSRGLVLFHVYCACNWGKYACINQLEKRKNCYFHEFMRDIFVKLTWNVKDIKK